MAAWGGDFKASIDQVAPAEPLTKAYATKLGAMYHGEAAAALSNPLVTGLKGQAQLIFTSPPFPLQTEKKYGNLKGDEYIEWFASFASSLSSYLTEDGSIVVEIGNAWEPGKPVMSTVVLRALLKFLEQGNLHLCQEFIWYNHARLPSPHQWVATERIRVKDAFTRIWWMSPVERPKADNRKVLREYSADMKRLVETQKYNPGLRPSQHLIGKKSFAKDNGGAIPPNVIGAEEVPTLGSILKATNTRSRDQYQLFCRDQEIKPHPARMPQELVTFFVRMLTDEGDLVLDPFGGSNTTGATAEAEGRRWISFDAEWAYVASSIGRFAPDSIVETCPEIAIEAVEPKAAVG